MSAIGRFSAGAPAALILTLGVSLPARAATITTTDLGDSAAGTPAGSGLTFDGADRTTLNQPNARIASLTRWRS